MSLRPRGGGGGAVDGQDLPSSCGGGHVVPSLLPGAQQPVDHQSLPGATEVRSVGVREGGGGGSAVAPPDGMAGGKHSDPVISVGGGATDEILTVL